MEENLPGSRKGGNRSSSRTPSLPPPSPFPFRRLPQVLFLPSTTLWDPSEYLDASIDPWALESRASRDERWTRSPASQMDLSFVFSPRSSSNLSSLSTLADPFQSPPLFSFVQIAQKLDQIPSQSRSERVPVSASSLPSFLPSFQCISLLATFPLRAW